MPEYPRLITEIDHVEPVPRRIRATLGARTMVDTVNAIYVWEIPPYPAYYIPIADVESSAVIDENFSQKLRRGTAKRIGLRSGDVTRPGCGHLYGDDAALGLSGFVRFDWAAMDAWYEEDERVFVHPRSPYARVDALRSTRTVRVEFDGTVLAESRSPVMVFETGLPARYYLNQSDVDFSRLVPSDTETSCPYKGTTTGYWSVRAPDGTLHRDLAWCYDFPTRALTPIAGLVAFYNEKVDLILDGNPLERPVTPFSRD
jgi:uncharacterized protein (DUF427 family)